MFEIDTELMYYSFDPTQFTKQIGFSFDEDDLALVKTGEKDHVYSSIYEFLIKDFVEECKNLHVYPDMAFFHAQWEDIEKEVTYALVKELCG